MRFCAATSAWRALWIARDRARAGSVAAAGDWLQANVRVAVVLKGVEREQQIPVAIEREDGHVVARGSLQLNQTDFGMTPFSVGGGAIQVADTLEIRFEIVADRP